MAVLRRDFGGTCGTITAYRTGSGQKVHLSVSGDPTSTPLGRTFDSVIAAAESDNARLLLRDGAGAPIGRVRFGQLTPMTTDAAPAFDPIRNAPRDLHPSGTIHGTRAFAYRLGQRWRGARPANPDPGAVTRTATLS
ncbi:hypothetical protein GCM10010435_03010 [Winogradskya consettensis]|uniref:Uncharacterized protein n=1 Tax=Winogradskya consettensis TaxID=113560 RepID=A0A919W0M9_9ACTN|nr:hypothetical protein [Actinoplanes consettensis]GIM81960.1 hypothetical protein Aco04nite_79260 [Actinoplanes consettensis]